MFHGLFSCETVAFLGQLLLTELCQASTFSGIHFFELTGGLRAGGVGFPREGRRSESVSQTGAAREDIVGEFAEFAVLTVAVNRLEGVSQVTVKRRIVLGDVEQWLLFGFMPTLRDGRTCQAACVP